MKKTLIWTVVVFALLVGGFYALNSYIYNEKQAEDVAGSEVTNDSVVWTFQEEGEDELTLAPVTRVLVAIKGATYDTGTYAGSCAELEASELSEKQVSGALCWWAGFGDEIGVFRGEDGVYIRTREVEEGTAESVGFKSEFKTLLLVR